MPNCTNRQVVYIYICLYPISRYPLESVKITCDMGEHTVIYLDESYLSNMAKAQLGSLTDQDECEFWLSLLEELKDKVLADRIACPEFAFQREEASFDTRIEEAVGRIIDELSRGLKFNTWKDILNLHIEDAAFKFLGKDPPTREIWAIAFESDPQAPLKTRIQGVRPRPKWGIDGYPPLRKEVLGHERLKKARWATFAKKTLWLYGVRNWDETLRDDKLYAVDCILGREAWSDAVTLGNIRSFVNRWMRLLEIGINDDNFMDFLKSDELLNSAFIDIHSSIRTAAAVNFPNRGQKGSDLYDPVILATVMPYCDIVTTDKFMKHISVTRLGLDKKYKCEVFSPSKEDRLDFQKGVRIASR